MCDVPKNWKTMPAHPLAEKFPRPTEAEHMAIVGGMRDRGYDKRQPITIADGMILDGISRRAAAIEAEVIPSFEEYKGNDQAGFVITRNVHRRHLDTSQRQMVAADMVIYYRENIPANLPSVNIPMTPSRAAEQLNVSERGVRQAISVQAEAEPEVVDAVRKGEITTTDATGIKAKSPAKQRSAIGKVRKGKARTASAAAGKHAGQTLAEKAAARIAQHQKHSGDVPTVVCRYCGGKGHVPDESFDYPPELDTPEFHEAWIRWIAERRAKKIKPLTPGGAKAKLNEMAAWGAPKAIFAIETSIGNSWQGIFEPGANGKGKDPYAGIKEWLQTQEGK